MLDKNASILWIVPRRLGDTLFQTPGMRFTKECRPDVSIDVVTITQVSAEIFKHAPYVRRVIACPSKKTLKQLGQDYTVVISSMPGKTGKCLEALIGRTAVLLGGNGHDMHITRRSILGVQSLFKLEKACDNYNYALYPQAHHFDRVKAILAGHGISPQETPLVGIHVGCRKIAKHPYKFWQRNLKDSCRTWSLEGFISLIQRINKEWPAVKILITGTKGEGRFASKIIRNTDNTISLIDALSLHELTALMEESLDCYIAGDTGTLHVAYSTKVPVIALFAPLHARDPDRHGPPPGRPHSVVLQGDGSVTSISVASVYSSLKSLLQRKILGKMVVAND